MEPLSEEFVDMMFEKTSYLTEEEAYEESVRVSQKQPGILRFITELTGAFDEEIQELAIYMFFIIYRMFESAYGRPINEVTSDEILLAYSENERLIESLGGDNEKFFEQVAKVQMASQPYVVRYVVETLFEALQDDNPLLLGEEDLGFLFLVMKTVIDVLNLKTDD